MTLLSYGFSHRSAPIDVLHAMAVPAELHTKALTSLLQREHVTEALILSTCNRVEVYANVTRYHGGMFDLRNYFAEWSGLDYNEFTPHTYDRFDIAAAEHLFAVSSGLESMVVGERQIHSQLRQAYARSIEENASGPLLHHVVGQAINVGRRTRNETSISDGASSIVDLALATAQQPLATDRPNVVLVGAGKIGGMVAERLPENAAGVTIVNRTVEKAEELADKIDATAQPFDTMLSTLYNADLAVFSTDTARPLVYGDDVAEVMANRLDRPLVMVDLAVPRDVDTSVGDVEGVTVIGIGELRQRLVDGPSRAAVVTARSIVRDEAHEFARWNRGVHAGPTIASLRQKAESVRNEELHRLSAKLSTLDQTQRDAVDAVTKGIINTLLHEPTVRIKRLVDTPDGETYIRAISHLFDLELEENPDKDSDDAE